MEIKGDKLSYRLFNHPILGRLSTIKEKTDLRKGRIKKKNEGLIQEQKETSFF